MASQNVNNVGKFIDLTNQKFGMLLVVKKSDKKDRSIWWDCRCDCGNPDLIPIRGDRLRSGITTSCCMLKESLVGQKFNRLTVLYRDFSKIGKDRNYWICECECGKITSVRASHLKDNSVKSCGCYLKDWLVETKVVDLTGNRYGKLTVVKPIKDTRAKVQFWLCKCDCGKKKIARSGDLKSGYTKSCGCIRSWKEEEIQNILIENNIKFKREFTFDDLIDKRNLRFDFALFNDEKLIGLIEYHGDQHYNKKLKYYSASLIKHDRMKIKYCEKNFIPLLILNKTNTQLLQEIINFIEKESG